MATMLAACAVAGSMLALLYATLAPQTVPRPVRLHALLRGDLRPVVVLAAIAVAALFLLTVPTVRPFSPGLTLGLGFLIGAALGLWSLYEATGGLEGQEWVARTAAQLALASLGPGAVLLVFHGYPNAALVGCALGATLVAALSATVLRPAFAAAEDERRLTLSAYRGVELYALATAAIVAGMWLGIEHFPRAGPAHEAGGYWAIPALLPAVAALVLIVVSEWPARGQPAWPALGAGFLASALSVIALFALRAKPLPQLASEPCWYGFLAMAFILVALYQSGWVAGDTGKARPVSLAFGAVLLALAVMTAAFRRQHGYGEALAVVAALPVVASAYLARGRTREPVDESLALGALTIMLLLALYRVFLERAPRATELDFQRHYDVVGVVLGLGACFGLLAFSLRGVEHLRGRAPNAGFLLARPVLLGLAVTAVPLVLAAVWGASAIGAFLTGLVFAEATWMMLLAWTAGPDRDLILAAAPHLHFVAVALIAIQFGPLVLSVELPRLAKLIVVAVVTLIAVVWLFADAWRRSRPEEGGGEQ